MLTVSQHLWFEKDMEAALRFYVSLLPGSSLDWIRSLPDGTPSGPESSVRVAAFTLGDQRYLATQAGKLDPFNHSFSVTVQCDDQAEIDRLWDALKDGGSEERCGWVRDRWGLFWQIIPKRLGALMQGESAAQVTAAMLGMAKFDLAALEVAGGN